MIETIKFENEELTIIDQTILPNRFEYIHLNTLDEVIDAVKKLKVRGAPAIGVTAAYGFYNYIRSLEGKSRFDEKKVLSAAVRLKESRPTAVNLQWAVDEMVSTYKKSYFEKDSDQMLQALKENALKIHDDDRLSCKQIGEFGAKIVSDNFNILTHCNAGILATGGMGTALSVIYSAADQDKNIHVYVDETRPVGQGARLTFWELTTNNIPATLIADNMAGSLMKKGKIDMIVVGADRIALNGDTANKIGTYPLAVLASYHKIPFYIAAPVSTFDKEIKSGNEIPIEYRDKQEILSHWNIRDIKAGDVYNPAFDVTPAELISGIITEKGILNRPLEEKIKSILF